MPFSRVQCNYVRGATGKWSNVWHVDADGLLSAGTAFVAAAVPVLREVLLSGSFIKSVLVSDILSDDFWTIDVNAEGVRPATSNPLPLFNCVKAIYPVPGFGRPDLKYMKGFLIEEDQNDGMLETGARTAMDDALTEMIAAMIAEGFPLCADDGNQYTVVQVQPAVQMRQMHRKRKKTSPVV